MHCYISNLNVKQMLEPLGLATILWLEFPLHHPVWVHSGWTGTVAR